MFLVKACKALRFNAASTMQAPMQCYLIGQDCEVPFAFGKNNPLSPYSLVSLDCSGRHDFIRRVFLLRNPHLFFFLLRFLCRLP